ncbi:MAG: hypothetical protein HZB56_09325 [Deltaproteobacteria bacterium]|nr:hypothetical protein [Deltaproteobacteria bacterium]
MLLLLSALLAAPPSVAAADVPRLLARLAATDPPVEEVQRAAALRAAPTPSEAASWTSRARWSSWLPRLTTSFRHDERAQHTLGLTSTAEVDYVRLAPGNEVRVQLTWNLAEVAFSDAEVRTAEAAARAARLRAEAAERVTRLYFRRRSLLATLWLAPPDDPAARLAAELALDEATAELDFLTGGLFTRERAGVAVRP